MINFKEFILNENTVYLAGRIGDILNALQDLIDNLDNIGSRDINRAADNIVKEIRKIIRSKVPNDQVKHLETLQKCGYNIKKSIEEENKLENVLQSCVSEIEKILNDLEVTVNKI